MASDEFHFNEDVWNQNTILGLRPFDVAGQEI
jgi:hypothetical protein